jgi:two-component system cell cycle response regulator DivK
MVNQDAPIAIVEDNAPIRKLFATVLGKNGFKTIEFGTAEEAINGLKESECSTILLDILLPDKNGTELIEDLRAIRNIKEVPIIAVTGFAQTSDQQKFMKLGFDGFIAKPINTSSFVNEIKEYRTNKFDN